MFYLSEEQIIYVNVRVLCDYTKIIWINHKKLSQRNKHKIRNRMKCISLVIRKQMYENAF